MTAAGLTTLQIEGKVAHHLAEAERFLERGEISSNPDWATAYAVRASTHTQLAQTFIDLLFISRGSA
jgi:hypothetical protein